MSDVERLLAEAVHITRRLEMRLEQYKLHAMRGGRDDPAFMAEFEKAQRGL